MRTVLRIATIVAVLAAAYYGYQTMFPDDEGRIRTLLDDLAETVSQSGGEGLSQLARAARFGRFFTDGVVVDLGPPFSPIHGRDTIMALAAKAQIPGEGLAVRFVDVTVTVEPSELAARAAMTATVHGRSIGDLQAIDAKELEMALLKIDGEWRIDRVTGIQAIERPR